MVYYPVTLGALALAPTQAFAPAPALALAVAPALPPAFALTLALAVAFYATGNLERHTGSE